MEAQRNTHPFVALLISPQAIVLPSGGSVNMARFEYRFRLWQGAPISDTFGGKAVLNFNGEPVFAELAILRILEESGWEGVWVDTFRNRFLRCWPPQSCSISPHAQKLYDRIKQFNGGKRSGCFDLLAWKDNAYLFIESKKFAEDSIRQNQIKWLDAALKSGVPLSSFLICEWKLESE